MESKLIKKISLKHIISKDTINNLHSSKIINPSLEVEKSIVVETFSDFPNYIIFSEYVTLINTMIVNIKVLDCRRNISYKKRLLYIRTIRV